MFARIVFKAISGPDDWFVYAAWAGPLDPHKVEDFRNELRQIGWRERMGWEERIERGSLRVEIYHRLPSPPPELLQEKMPAKIVAELLSGNAPVVMLHGCCSSLRTLVRAVE